MLRYGAAFYDGEGPRDSRGSLGAFRLEAGVIINKRYSVVTEMKLARTHPPRLASRSLPVGHPSRSPKKAARGYQQRCL